MNRVPAVRWRRVRKTLNALRHILRGRFRFVTAADRVAPPSGWQIAGEFHTAIRQRPELGDENRNRIANMRKACDALRGVVLRPGRIFSLERLIGEPSVERGYLAGPIILSGKLGSAAGGGLCQLSTTLFNAALLANLEILEKHNHSADLWGDQRMVDLGKDAAYVWLRKDLLFRNPFPWPVVMEPEVAADDSRLSCRLWAPVSHAGTVEVRHQLLREEPRLVVRTVRVVSDAGGERVNFERIDVYETKGSVHRGGPRTA